MKRLIEENFAPSLASIGRRQAEPLDRNAAQRRGAIALLRRAVQMRHADYQLRRPLIGARQNGAGDQVFPGAAAQQGVKLPIHNQGKRIQIRGVAEIHQLQPGAQGVAAINQNGQSRFRPWPGPTEAALRPFLRRVELPGFGQVGGGIEDKALRQRRFSGLAHGPYVIDDAGKKPAMPKRSFPA